MTGFAAGLSAWRPLLAEGGHLAVTEAEDVLQSERREIAMFREHSGCYGYVFFIARRR